MSTHTSEQITGTPAPMPNTSPLTTTPSSPTRTPSHNAVSGNKASKRLYWSLIALAVLLNSGIVFMIYHTVFAKKEAPPSPNSIAVLYAKDKDLWQSWRGLIVQEEGRQKPFESFCIDTVRYITGREKFEKNDPVAVIVSWMMTYQSEGNTPSYGKMRKMTASLGADEEKKIKGCNWDNYPFILCDFHELRQKIYEEAFPGKELTEEQKYGKYIEPSILRESKVLINLVRDASMKRANDKLAILPMVQRKAQDVYGRFNQFEATRSGRAFAVVALDNVGPTWFALMELKAMTDPLSLPGNPTHSEVDKAAAPLWAKVIDDRALASPELYKGKSQDYPAESVHKVVNAFQSAQTAYLKNDEAAFTTASKELIDTIQKVSASHRPSYPDAELAGMERTFNKVVPFQKAWIFCLMATLMLALFTLVGSRFTKLGNGLYLAGLISFAAGLGSATYGFFCRVSISGRPPVSDMYETIIWVSFMTGVFGLILELVYRKGFIALAAAMVSTLGFVLADQLPTTFSPSIKPLEPVLRSNYWLIIHVLTIVSSYAAFALAWGLGNLNIGLILYAPDRKDLIRTLSHYSYKAIQIGVILLFLGTMLGGWWADESWGRFWGWDPKEVWALIAFLAYIIPLHARFVGWIKDFGLAACSVICFSFVVMAWYGVNFVLGAGLHSYGFGSGNNDWLYLAGLTNISLVVHAAMRYTNRGEHLVAE